MHISALIERLQEIQARLGDIVVYTKEYGSPYRSSIMGFEPDNFDRWNKYPLLIIGQPMGLDKYMEHVEKHMDVTERGTNAIN